MVQEIEWVECPRDAMQGIKTFIPTEEKINYLNVLLKVGFDVLDFGSFVSPKAIPQLHDTEEVLANLDLENSQTKLLAIVANLRGAEQAVLHKEITYLGYPFSLSETFQRRNTNRGIAEAKADVLKILELCEKNNKQLVVYLSMGFGNPYGDEWNPEIVGNWMQQLSENGIKIFSLADTVGTASTKDIAILFKTLIATYPQLTIGAHFHATPDLQLEKIDAAFVNGCRRFDSAMLGIGGCPMATDSLTGNISTEILLGYFKSKSVKIKLNEEAFSKAHQEAKVIFK